MNEPMQGQGEGQGPLATIPNAHQPVLALHERPLRGYLNLRGQPVQTAFLEAVQAVLGVAPPLAANTTLEANEVEIVWLAPNEWLLITARDAQGDLEASLRHALAGLFAAVTDVSSGYTTFEIVGPQARDLLARGCALDLHPRVFGPGQAATTLLAKADVTIVQANAVPAFHVIVRRSLAVYLWRWLDDAAADMRHCR